MLPNLLALFQQQKAVSTDSRSIPNGAIFFALKGEKFDGNQYAAQALDKGAAYVVVDNPSCVKQGDPRYILTDNTLNTLQGLGKAYRRTLNIPVLGITGSNGKTTTKELIASVLKTEKRISATRGNLNNHIGVPLTLLSIPKDTEMAIVEMGANQPDDIKELVEIAEPTHGLITNIGKAHLERLKGIEGVKKVKGQLFDFIREHNGFAFINGADTNVVSVAEGITQCVVYDKAKAGFSYIILKQSLTEMQLLVSSVFWEKPEIFKAQLTGEYNAQNIVAAIAVGHVFGISVGNIKKGIYDYVPMNHRSQIIHKGNLILWMDAYNANPASMKAAIRNIFLSNPDKKIALILGDMFELGEESEKEHIEIGQFVKEFSPVLTLWVGREMRYAAAQFGTEAHYYESYELLPPALDKTLQVAEIVLIKGSRGMALERLLDRL